MSAFKEFARKAKNAVCDKRSSRFLVRRNTKRLKQKLLNGGDIRIIEVFWLGDPGKLVEVFLETVSTRREAQ